MYSDDQYIQLSSLQHYIFCPRQCALIHVCGLWAENHFTAKGEIFHERVHSDESETRHDIHTERGLTIISKRLGLSGKTDAVEFIEKDSGRIVRPIEYKSGKPKNDHSDEVQLCAQALCLEEMMSITIDSGALFYGQTRHRMNVPLTAELRAETEDIIEKVHRIVETRVVPEAVPDRRCSSCSLEDQCMPYSPGNKRLKTYIEELYSDHETTS